MESETHETIRQLLQGSSKPLVVSHIRPDGDAVGSLLGFGLALEAVGKQVQMVLVDGVPSTFRHLPGNEKVKRSAKGDYDLAIVVDASDLQRIGGVLGGRIPDLVIDHHVTNLYFGKANFILPDSVATCAILAEFLPRWGLPITAAVARALLTGIITDSIGFRTSNTSPIALRLAADLMEVGADLSALYTQALVKRSFEAVNYWGYGLMKLQRQGRLIWTSLTLAERARVNYPGSDDADLCNVLSAVENADVSLLFIEQKNRHVKISWRSQNGCDVSQLAVKFGGGGHAAAAGADVPGSLEEVQDRVLQVTQAYLDNESANGCKNATQ